MTGKMPRTGRAGPWFATRLLLALALVALGAWVFLRPAPEPRVVRALIAPPGDAAYVVTGIGAGAAVLSPDGTRLAFTARLAGRSQLWVRSLDRLKAVPLPGTGGARRLFWLPDGEFIAFFAMGKLKKISAAAGPPLVLADAPDGRGGSWNWDGVIIFTPNYLGPVYRITAGGGEPAPVTAGDRSRVYTHRYPYFLPDGDHFLFLDRGTTAGAGENPTIRAASLGDGVSAGTPVLQAASNVAYDDGRLLYTRDGTLLAQPFDPGALRITGDPAVVASDVVYDIAFSRGAFSVSRNGILAYHAGQASINTQLTWFDREGNELGRVDEPGQYNGLVLSPGGRMLAASRMNGQTGKGDIWVYDLERGTKSRLSFDEGDDYCPVWTPDGNRVAFSSARQHGHQPYVKPADGSGAAELLFASDGDVFLFGWMPDGRTLVFGAGMPSGATALRMATDGEMTSLWNLPGDHGTAELSTDGRWIAYVSDESGRSEVFVGPFPEASAKWQISAGGGVEPRWREDGKEIFYRTQEGILMAAEISTTGRRVAVGTVRPLFRTSSESIRGSYDVSPDGQRFIVNAPLEENRPKPVTLVLNWTAELED
ncbi:MAG: TolB family protein [Acidobacteriota bacterium]